MLLLVLLVMHGEGSCGGAKLLASAAGALSFEVEVPPPRLVTGADGGVRVLLEGYGTFSPAGAPELPGRIFRVAVPPSGPVRISFSVTGEEALGRPRISRVRGERLVPGENGVPAVEIYYPPDTIPFEWPREIVSAGGPSFMGRQRVLPVRVEPLFRGEGGEIRLARRISVTVTFGGARHPGGSPPVRPSGAWKRLYGELLVNPGDVSRFGRPAPERAGFTGRYGGTRNLKVEIPETGTYIARADSLIAAGLSEGLSTGELALKRYYYDEEEPDLVREVDIPILVVEDGSASEGIFDAGDLLVFHALGIRDDAEAGDTIAMFTENNVLWLEEQSAGAVMDASLSLPGEPGVARSFFRARFKGRRDTFFWKKATSYSRDFNFVKGPDVTESVIPFEMRDPDGAGTFSLEAVVQGSKTDLYDQTLTFAVRNASGTRTIGSGGVSGKDRMTFVFNALPAGWLEDGENSLVITSDADYVYAMLDNFSVSYPALFVARNDVLEFSVRSLSRLTVSIEGFSTDRGVLVEITDHSSPVYRELAPADFTQSEGTYTLRLNIDAPMGRSFAAVGAKAGGNLGAGNVSVDVPSDLRGEQGPYNTLLVYHRDLMIPALDTYISWRRNQGYGVLGAEVQDIYDEFNGGAPSTEAIRRFIKYGFERWGVEFVLLLGDGNEDHRSLTEGYLPGTRGSPPDYIPPYTYCVELGGIYDAEVIASDKWYAFLDGDPPLPLSVSSGQAATDRYPDVFVGRMPVGRDVELKAMLSKIYSFEAPEVTDAWRRRILLFADDAWSGRGTDYRYRSHEGEFEASLEEVASSIETSLEGGFDIRRLYLSHWTDGVHESLTESGPAVYSKSHDSTRTYFTPYLIKRLNEGCLLFTFQGHGNRALLTTERAFATTNYFSDQDSFDINIPHKSSIFVGIGCHISDFSHMGELNLSNFDGPNGDCFSEQLLFVPGAGSVAAYASGAYELLSQNAALCEEVLARIFQNPPVDSVPPGMEYTGAHWILGEALTAAEISHIDKYSYGLEQLTRYNLLGDPMLKIDPGPPLMKLYTDFGDSLTAVTGGSLRARNGTNDCLLRFTASDVVALGAVTLEVDGVDLTDSLEIAPLKDGGSTFARAYGAEMDYRIGLEDASLVFRVQRPDGREAGVLEARVETRMRLFLNEVEIIPSAESPPSGTFRMEVDFPAYVGREPVFILDGHVQPDVRFAVPEGSDSLHWEAVFERNLSAGRHIFSAAVGDVRKDFEFTVRGGGLMAESFNIPNPFRDGTNIVYSISHPVDGGEIEIYNVSGRLLRALRLPLDGLEAASLASPHSVYWDGLDLAGDPIANGTYIYVIRFERNGSRHETKGKMVRLR